MKSLHKKGDTKKFNGKIYKYHGTYDSLTEANNEMRRWKNNNYRIRIIKKKRKNGKTIYITWKCSPYSYFVPSIFG